MNYRTHIVSSLSEIGQPAWDGLALAQAAQQSRSCRTPSCMRCTSPAAPAPSPAGSRNSSCLYDGDVLAAAMPLYVKMHSYGEYVFDWAWADAYQRNGLDYYPKLLSAIPFTPGHRPAPDGGRRAARAPRWSRCCARPSRRPDVSSTHILYPPEDQAQQLADAGFMLRSGVQFHWLNAGYKDFDAFLATLEQKKRKNIRAERRKVREAGVTLRRVRGADAHRRRLAPVQPLLPAHLRGAPLDALPEPGFLPAHRPRHAAQYPAGDRRARRRAGGVVAGDPLGGHAVRPLLGRAGTRALPALRDRLLPAAGVLHRAEASPCSKAAPRASTRWRAASCRPRPGRRTGWRIPRFADAIERFLEREAGGIDDYIDELNDRNPFRARD